MLSTQIIGIIVILGGGWVFQDAVASILYYLKRDDEKWYYNHLLRILRLLWGAVLIYSGIIVITGG